VHGPQTGMSSVHNVQLIPIRYALRASNNHGPAAPPSSSVPPRLPTALRSPGQCVFDWTVPRIHACAHTELAKMVYHSGCSELPFLSTANPFALLTSAVVIEHWAADRRVGLVTAANRFASSFPAARSHAIDSGAAYFPQQVAWPQTGFSLQSAIALLCVRKLSDAHIIFPPYVMHVELT